MGAATEVPARMMRTRGLYASIPTNDQSFLMDDVSVFVENVFALKEQQDWYARLPSPGSTVFCLSPAAIRRRVAPRLLIPGSPL